MAESLMVGTHKYATKKYRRNYEMIFSTDLQQKIDYLLDLFNKLTYSKDEFINVKIMSIRRDLEEIKSYYEDNNVDN